MQKQEKIEYYMAKPSLKQIYGKKINKNTEFDEWTEDKSIHQVLKELVLTTFIKKESEFCGIKSVEESKLVQTLKEGTILLWNEQLGYIIPQCQVCTLDELLNEIEQFKEIYKGENIDDTIRNEK